MFSRPAGGGIGTIFSIKAEIGVDIEEYSSYSEKEVLLPPGMTFIVKACVRNAGGFNHITIEHDTSVPLLVM